MIGKLIVMVLLGVMMGGVGQAQRMKAFPEAEGFGAYAIGGRGGQLFWVTTLADYGKDEAPIEGSLRAAIEATGPRMVLFKVGGLLNSKPP